MGPPPVKPKLFSPVLYKKGPLERVIVRKDLLSKKKVLQEVKAVRRELEGGRGR